MKKNNVKFQNLVNTAADLFKQFGMKRVSVEEICSKSNVSKATFYKHFKNKNELIKYIFNSWFVDAYLQMEIIDNKSIPFPDKIKEIFQIKKNIVNKMSPEFIEEYLNLSQDLLPFFEKAKNESFQKFSKYIKKWQKEGHIRSNVRPEFILVAMESLEHFTKVKSLPDLYSEYIDFVEEIFNFFFYGILNERYQDET